MTDNSLELFPKAINAQRDTVQLTDVGQISYYSDVTQPGIPLLLLHSINAAPSAMEVQPLFEHYRKHRPVYALDLPGFGASQRQDMNYNSTFFSNAIDAFVREIIGEECDVAALSLTSEFIARSALQNSTPFRSLCMISPTGFTTKKMPGENGGDKIAKFLGTPLIGSGLFRLLTTKPSIRYFLGLSFDGKPPAQLVDYALMTAKHPAARFAPFSFVSGTLFDRNAAANLYQKLELPVQVLYDQDPNISFEKLPSVTQDRDNWQVDRIPNTMGLPHWTHLAETTHAMDHFWSQLDSTK